MGVDAPVVRFKRAAERLFRQYRAGLNLPGSPRQSLEHEEFRAGQTDLAILQRDGERLRIETQGSDVQILTARSPGDVATAQNGPNARHKLARIEWLGEVIVGTQLESRDAVVIAAARGQHQHRNLRTPAQP